MIRSLAWTVWGAVEWAVFPYFLLAWLLAEAWIAVQALQIPAMEPA